VCWDEGVINPAEVLDLFDLQMRQGIQPDGPEARVEHVGAVVRHIDPFGGWNGVVWSDLDRDTADTAIAEQLRHFSDLGCELEWKLYAHDRPEDLAERLLAAGFVPEPEEALMVVAISDLPTGAALPEGVRLLPVTDPDGVDLMIEVHERAFASDSARLRNRLLAQVDQGPETFSMVVAMAGDEPVCAARMEMHPGTDFAGLWGGGTVPDWRGRGLYRALVAHRARIAAERGFRYLQVDASDDSRPILQRLGFTRLSSTTPYLHGPEAADPR
jgi:GNAT superfamily N-acetyltransferase